MFQDKSVFKTDSGGTFLKVLKKADMIRKNAVESILAERNILILVRNPFVVSGPPKCTVHFKNALHLELLSNMYF